MVPSRGWPSSLPFALEIMPRSWGSSHRAVVAVRERPRLCNNNNSNNKQLLNKERKNFRCSNVALMQWCVFVLLLVVLSDCVCTTSATVSTAEVTSSALLGEQVVVTATADETPDAVVEEGGEEEGESYFEEEDEEEEEDSSEDEEEESNEEGQYESYSVQKLWIHFECDEVFEAPRPIHNESTWSYMRGVYHGLVERRYSMSPYGSGFAVPIEVRQAEGDKGRGVFAAGRVQGGDLVWSSSETAHFEDGETYRQFLVIIGKELACDVLQWAYVMEAGEDLFQICVDLDEGSFMNGSYQGRHLANVGSVRGDEHDEKGCTQTLVATRDIEQGEEIVTDYQDFAVSSGWQWFGL